MNQRFKFGVFLITLTSLTACMGNRIGPIERIFPNQVIDSLLNRSELSLLNLDNALRKEVFPLVNAHQISKDHGLFLADPTSLTVLRDSIYITDRVNNAIMVSTLDGQLVRRIGRSGKAPGEYLEPVSITGNTKYFYIHDFKNSRIQVLDSWLNYRTSYPVFVLPLPFGSSVAANDQTLIIRSHQRTGALISILSAEPPLREIRSEFPLVIPLGEQPSAMNFVRFAINQQGEYCVAYVGLPFLFMHNRNGRHFATIQFVGKEVASLTKPISREVRFSHGSPVRYFFYALRMLDDSRIIMANKIDVFFLRRDNNKYEMELRLQLSIQEKYANLKPVIRDLAYYQGRLYVIFDAIPEIFCYKLWE